MAGPFLDKAGLSAFLESHREEIDSIYAKISALSEFYKKTETMSKTEIETLVGNINHLRILNKDGKVEATTTTFDSVLDAYVQTNYSRTPENYDAILTVLTDDNNDVVLYMYSEESAAWVDTSRNLQIDISDATDAIAGIAKLYNSLGTQTDGGITPSAVKTETDAIRGLITTLTNTVNGKANAVHTHTAADITDLTGTVNTLISAQLPTAIPVSEIEAIFTSSGETE